MNATRLCSVEGCEGAHEARGLCSPHYQRLRRTGRIGRAKVGLADEERLREKFSVSASGCWLWNGPLSSDGYGKFQMRSRSRIAHRAAYEIIVGPIPAGLELDHLCRVRHCVNPEHLEPVTQAENTRRSDIPWMVVKRSGRCKNGHLLAETGIKRRRGDRQHIICGECHRAYSRKASRRYRERRSAILVEGGAQRPI